MITGAAGEPTAASAFVDQPVIGSDTMHKLGPIILSAGLLASPIAAHAQNLTEMRQRTAEIATRYLQIWSSNDAAAVEGVPYVYGQTTLFYGKPYTQGQLIAEKRRAIRQWPVRRYVHRPGTMQVICNPPAQKCAARSIIDFEVSNPRRGTAKHGSARFDLGVSFAGPHPRILYENGSLNRRRR